MLADGQIVEASANSYSDLFYALKGGSNNFGVVTRSDLKTFPQGKFWGGFIECVQRIKDLHMQSADRSTYTIDTLSQQIQALVDFANKADYDIYAALINSYSYTTANGWLVANSYEHTKPTTYPLVF